MCSTPANLVADRVVLLDCGVDEATCTGATTGSCSGVTPNWRAADATCELQNNQPGCCAEIGGTEGDATTCETLQSFADPISTAAHCADDSPVDGVSFANFMFTAGAMWGCCSDQVTCCASPNAECLANPPGVRSINVNFEGLFGGGGGCTVPTGAPDGTLNLNFCGLFGGNQ
eukprot:CAMPEP_0205823804 /NCGR_PEP_ID=MMETSP0206-20130828/17957_1 /ASSEMBLY_ACC=CAM_ASM_000279 /TAXON_ID=36767 /ORGANISM="Euplotes focardii, Strain TN1" /LENGTH=172 /DNA_ID=CAMNT_0053121291 /DNA_START=75 /DNA_END=593 /DNA_ORIENTATION=-